MIALMAFASCLWLALVVLAPLLPVPLAASVYLAGSLICHQLPDRSFHFAAAQLPLCGRCVGIYAGAAVAMWLASRRPPPVPHSVRIIVFGASIPTVATVALESIGLWHTSNAVRCIAGLPFGAAVAFVVATAVAKLNYDACQPQRPIGPHLPPTSI